MSNHGYSSMSIIHESSYSSYTLDSDESFSSSDYKLMMGQGNSGMLPCIRSRYNGLPKLTYFHEKLMPIRSCIAEISPNQFVTLFASIVDVIVCVEKNGFLDICKIDTGIDAFYVDIENGDIGIIYLPVSYKVSGKNKIDAFDSFCQSMLLTMDNSSALKPLSPIINSLKISSMGRFGILSEKLKEHFGVEPKSYGSRYMPESDGIENNEKITPMVSSIVTSTIYKIEEKGGQRSITIDKVNESIIIGKSQHYADYIIGDIPTVSNRHCEISSSSRGLFIQDLNSTNGTFINGHRLKPQERMQIYHGDELRISKVIFKVREVSRHE